MDTAELVDRVEATCPQALEQLEDELLTVSTARLLLEKMNFFFRISDKKKRRRSAD